MTAWIDLARARHPDRVAVEAAGGSLTYAGLAEAAARAAAQLGEERGPVAIAMPPGIEWAIALHACLRAGRPVQPVDLRLGAEEQAVRRQGATRLIDGPGGLLAGPPTVGATAAGRAGGPDPDRVVAVMHTSGTTSEPKPVELTQGNFMASALGSAVALGLDPDERWLCPMPLTHVGGLSILIRSAIYATTVVLHGRFDTGAVLEELMRPDRRITLVSLVPTMLARLLDAGLQAPPTLRWALLGGGPIPAGLLERAAAAGVPVAPTYGMTEACSQIATFGFPLPGVELQLTDQGEILVRGAIVAPGAADERGWLHTGDLGRLDQRGALAIVGRASDTIVTGGENVAPSEVESVLLEHPSVADAGVFARPDAEWGEAVVARVVLRPGAAAAAEELKTFLRGRLAAFKVPKAIELADELPRTASGKLLRRELV